MSSVEKIGTETEDRGIAKVVRDVSSYSRYTTDGNPVCRLCGQSHADLRSHIVDSHGITAEVYQERYPEFPLDPREGEGGAKTLSYKDREQKEFSVKDTFGFYWSEKKGKGKDKDVVGYAEPGPLTPKINPAYVFNREYTQIALLGLHLRDKVLTHGPTGAGKTSMWEQIAARLNYNCVRINFDAGVTRADLIGQWTVRGKSMEFSYGILPSAMTLPGTIICFDEWDSVGEECAFVLQRPLEENSQLLLLEKGEEVITLHKDNMIVATANTAGMGDETGLYSTGTRMQNFSQINRFSLTIEVDYLPAEEEKRILTERFPELDEVEAEYMVRVGNAVREGFVKNEVVAPLSTRDLINWAEKYGLLGDFERAAKFCFVDRMPTEDKEVVRALIRRAYE